MYSFNYASALFGYLDPGTSNFFMQLIIAALLGGLFAIKLCWNKIKAFFGSVFFKKEKCDKK